MAGARHGRFGVASTAGLVVLVARDRGRLPKVPALLVGVWRDPPREWVAFVLGVILAIPLLGGYHPYLFDDPDSANLIASIKQVQRGNLGYVADTQETLLPHVLLGLAVAVGGRRASRCAPASRAPPVADPAVAPEARLEVLSERDADTRAQLAHLADEVRRVQGDVETLAADLRAGVAGTAHALDKLDQRPRRDLGYALDRLATGTTAEFIAHEMPAARAFDHPYDTLRWALCPRRHPTAWRSSSGSGWEGPCR